MQANTKGQFRGKNAEGTADFTRVMTVTAMLTAMNIVMSSFGIPVPGGHFYLNDVIICTAALLLDPFPAFVVGGIGAFLGDLLFYPTPMFVSLVTHGLQAVIISMMSHRKGEEPLAARGAVAVTFGAVIMVVGYSLGRAFLYSTPQYALLKLPYQILQAVIGAVVAMILVFKLNLYKVYRRIVFGQ